MKNHGTASKLESGQLAELAAAIVRQLPHIEGLGEVAQGWIENGAALKKALAEALVPIAEASNALLDFVCEVLVPASKKFLAKEHFTKNNKDGVKFYGFGSNFEANFLDKEEAPQSKRKLRCHKLKKNSPGESILEELGDKAEITLSDIWELLKEQPDGRPGKLLTNGYANIFYVRDARRTLWAVNVYWHSDGWFAFAFSVTGPLEWYGGSQVFSRSLR